jgi:hypothetical protein
MEKPDLTPDTPSINDQIKYVDILIGKFSMLEHEVAMFRAIKENLITIKRLSVSPISVREQLMNAARESQKIENAIPLSKQVHDIVLEREDIDDRLFIATHLAAKLINSDQSIQDQYEYLHRAVDLAAQMQYILSPKQTKTDGQETDD